MAIKDSRKNSIPLHVEVKVNGKIAHKGNQKNLNNCEEDHRLTLRIPQWLMTKIDIKRKERVGTISRNLYILEVLDKATK